MNSILMLNTVNTLNGSISRIYNLVNAKTNISISFIEQTKRIIELFELKLKKQKDHSEETELLASLLQGSKNALNSLLSELNNKEKTDKVSYDIIEQLGSVNSTSKTMCSLLKKLLI